MGYTIAEKILGRASRAGVPVPAGTEVEVKPDYVLGYDFRVIVRLPSDGADAGAAFLHTTTCSNSGLITRFDMR